MQIHHSLEEAAAYSREIDRPSVVTIGSFDGIHLAHQELLRRVRQRALENSATSVAITFDPHPVQVLAPQKAPKLLTPFPVKLALLEQSGLDRLLILPFTRELSLWSPQKFVEEVLAKALLAVVVVVGENFRFGHRQAGTPEVLEELSRSFRIRTEIFPQMSLRNIIVSSSQIRSLLQEGRVSLANRLLGRCFSVRSVVEAGLGIGSTQTVPTLNLGRYSELLPAAGVYITLARILTGLGGDAAAPAEMGSHPTALRSVTNVGRRPTFGERELGVETHLLERWDGPTPAALEVSFLYRLRDERKFPSPHELKSQIMKDVRRTETYFRRLDRFQVAALQD